MNTTIMKVVEFILLLVVAAMVTMSLFAGVLLFTWMGVMPLPIQQLVLQFVDLPSEMCMALLTDTITFVVVLVGGWELSKLLK